MSSQNPESGPGWSLNETVTRYEKSCLRISAMKKRRSSRVRKSRYIEKDGHTILKLNDYSLESGERSVYDVEASNAVSTSSIPQQKSAWSLFLADYHAGKLRKYEARSLSNEDVSMQTHVSMQTSQQRASKMWNTTFGPGTRLRQTYERASENLRRQIEELKERAIREARLKKEREIQMQLQAQIEADRRRDEIMKKERARRALAEKRRAERKAKEAKGIDVLSEQNLSPQELFRRRHNNSMKKRKESQERYRMEFFGARKSALEGFVDPKVCSVRVSIVITSQYNVILNTGTERATRREHFR